MRIIGYYTACHRIKTVRVAGPGLVSLVTSGVAQGVCDACTEKERGKK